MKEKKGKQEAAVENNFIQDRKRTKGPNPIRQLHPEKTAKPVPKS
jgi:hypothetical protein